MKRCVFLAAFNKQTHLVEPKRQFCGAAGPHPRPDQTAECDPPAAREPCGWGCSRAAPAEDGCTRSAERKGTRPAETGGWAPASWRGASGPEPSTSAAAGAGWRGAGLRHTQKHGVTRLKRVDGEDVRRRGSPAAAAACGCWGCWTGLAAGWLWGPPCCGGPPCWPWPVGVAEGWGCWGWGCKVALGWGYC